jgi:hypothetical protein
MASLPPVYIVSAVRTPIGGFQQFVIASNCFENLLILAYRSLASLTAVDLGSHAIKGSDELLDMIRPELTPK